jgi:HAD superfamily 5'-nucleotidase-like hydrolase
MHSNVYVNRTLNLRKIQYLGFDMDHTLVRYDSEAFENATHNVVLQKLVNEFDYPKETLTLSFSMDLAIRGLVMDKRKGNLLKLSRHAAIRASQHGLTPIPYAEQRKIYGSKYIDLKDSGFSSVDTAFSISTAVLFAQLVDLKDKGLALPDYETISNQMMQMVDKAHRDDSLKSMVRANVPKFIYRSENLVRSLERYRKHDKKLFILTNSDFQYTKLLLDYAINPFLKDFKDWSELFEITITAAQKPRFFFDDFKFLKVDLQTGAMTNHDSKLVPGIYQGGCAKIFTKDLCLEGDDILYIGDHIYGDILRLKKDCNWRTAMVIEDLEVEVAKIRKAEPITKQIELWMQEKNPLEREVVELLSQRIENPKSFTATQEQRLQLLQQAVQDIDKRIAPQIQVQQQLFNKYWGEVMRAGNEDSYFAQQVDRYACIYMSQLEDLLSLSPRSYFRALRRPQAHELNTGWTSDEVI